MNARILNREFQHPGDGWYQIEALGTHPNRAAGVVQVVDDEAAQAIVSRFNAAAAAGQLRHGNELLIDHEHFSGEQDQESRAYGWLQELQNREDGIYGRIRWTATGKAAVDGGDYRFFSTEYAPADLQKIANADDTHENTKTRKGLQPVRPLRLDGLTLTNMNNNRGQKPITNRESKCSHMNEDGTFKGGFDGCVLHMQTCEGHSEESAKKICGKIAQAKNRAGLRSGASARQAVPVKPADGRCPTCDGDLEEADHDGIQVCPQCNTTFDSRHAEFRPSAPAANQPNNTKKKMQNVATKLGLAAEASEDAVLDAVTKIQNRVTELEPLAAENTLLKNRAAQFDADQVAALLAERKITDDKVVNRLKPLLLPLTTREERVALLDDLNLKAPEAAKPAGRVLNRSTGIVATESGTVLDEQALTAKIKNRAAELKGIAPARKYEDCWNQAQREMLIKH